MTAKKVAASALLALTLAGCAGGPSSLGDSAPTGATPDGMAGRWMLSAPNAPACGMNFAGAQSAYEGTVVPDGGCPEKFFMSRRWTIEQGKLTINDRENNPLALLNAADGQFHGKSATGTPVTLTRPVIPPS